ncbi:MAG: hypothetical protein IJT97_03370 [Bacteroidaceae bacterium]|nr:hypothetical protein [Bacteroidaceae bacterium]
MRVKLQFIATAITVAGILFGMACKKFLPQYWTDEYVLILAFYWLVEMILSFVLEHYHRKSAESKKFIQVYMTAKGVKFILAIAFIVWGFTSIGIENETKSMIFAGWAVVFYLLHLTGETYVFVHNK